MVKRLKAKVGEYEKDGQKKGKYVDIGVIMSNNNGEYALLDPTVNLAGCLQQQNMMNHEAGRRTGDRLMVSVFDDDNRQQGGGSQGGGYGAGGRPSNDIEDDSIPFNLEWRI